MALQRRTVLETVTSLSVLFLAGCNGLGGGDPAQRDGRTSSPTPPPTTTEKWTTAVRPESRLVLYASRSLDVTVTMYADESETAEEASITYSLEQGETRHVTEFTPSGWIVLSMDREPVWEGWVTSADHYKLSLTEGKAVVTEHSEA
jgi:hypothetical protein